MAPSAPRATITGIRLQGAASSPAQGHLADGPRRQPARRASSPGPCRRVMPMRAVSKCTGQQVGRYRGQLFGRLQSPRWGRRGTPQAAKCAFSRARSCATDTALAAGDAGVAPPRLRARWRARSQIRSSPHRPTPGQLGQIWVFVTGVDVVVAHQPGAGAGRVGIEAPAVK